MAGFLKNFLNGVFGSDGYLRNQQHATRLYADDGFYNFSPKAGWMYYVIIKVNPVYSVTRELSTKWSARYKDMVGILAKSVQLPAFKILTETLNQYNRKTVVQTKLTYDPVIITWHDDMANATNDLWKNYYQYYCADGAYQGSRRTGAVGGINPAFEDTKVGPIHYKYGFNKPHEDPFFSSIEILQLNRQEYNSFRLVNPRITDWRHGELNQTQNAFLENRMTVAYESVIYDAGRIKGKFDQEIKNNHYDNVLSPVRPGGIFGAISGASDILGTVGDIASGNFNALDILKGVTQIQQTARTIKNITPDSIKAEGYSVIAGGAAAILKGAAAVPINREYRTNQVNVFKNLSNESVKAGITALPKSLGNI